MRNKDMGEYLLCGMRIQSSEMFEDFDLLLSGQVLVSEEDNTALVDEGSKLIQLRCIQLT